MALRRPSRPVGHFLLCIHQFYPHTMGLSHKFLSFVTARSKNPCDQIPGQSIVQISVPSLKTIDFVERGFKEVLKMNKLQWRKLKLIVDCERVPEKELKTSMKIICYTLDDTRGSDSCITTCEFCDTRLEMFECMTKIIDAHFNNKDFEVLEWRGMLYIIIVHVYVLTLPICDIVHRILACLFF